MRGGARADWLAATLATAERVVAALRAHDADAVVIGAMALAVHGYPRDTVDLDRNAELDRRRLRALCRRLGLGEELTRTLRAASHR